MDLKIEYPRSSPYFSTPQSSWLLGRYSHRRIDPQNDDIYVTLESGHQHRPDALSQTLYGTPVYWWVFTVCNTRVIRDPIWDMKTGMTIRAPSLRYIKSVIG